MPNVLSEIEAGRLAYIVEQALFPRPWWKFWSKPKRYSRHDGYNAFRALMVDRADIQNDRDHQRNHRHLNAAKVLSREAIIEADGQIIERLIALIAAFGVGYKTGDMTYADELFLALPDDLRNVIVKAEMTLSESHGN